MYEHYSQSSESSIKPAREIWNTLSQESMDKGSLVSSSMPEALVVCKEDLPLHNSNTPSHHLSLPTFFFFLSFLFCVIPLSVSSFTCPPSSLSVLQWGSGVVKAGPGWARARPKFVPLMCMRALVLLAQWLSVQQVPGQYQ